MYSACVLFTHATQHIYVSIIYIQTKIIFINVTY